MATVTQPQIYDHEGNQQRVRHPLQQLRGTIRRYIILEGLALTHLFAVAVFWIGLFCDFGLYALDFELIAAGLLRVAPEWDWLTKLINLIGSINVHGLDWIQELNDVDPSGVSSRGVRIVVLAAIVIGLVALGITKVVVRWVREFNDQALALVLERRFPKQLGDRLITAVELADPKLAKAYGFSQVMIEKTIIDAVETLKTLPVGDVFNWGRLYKLWGYLGLATIGGFLATMLLFLVGSWTFAKETVTPYEFSWRFADAAAIWTERNLMLMDSYWPRRSYLEIGRFQPSQLDKNVMRVARDDVKPDLHVRAIEWVVADRKEPSGWRALKWKDLPRFVDQATLDGVKIPADFPDWVVDLDELEPNLVTALFGSDTQPRRIVEVRKHLDQPAAQKKIGERKATGELNEWLDWTEWSVDKLAQQMEEAEVRNPLRDLGDKTVYDKLEAIVQKLNERAESPSMSRTLRKLVIPANVEVTFRGEETGSTNTFKKQAGNRYIVPLESLKDSTNFKFRARGEDYFTPPKTITLVAAPTPATINLDKEEPAYIYHRLHGVDQTPLRGVKHVTKNYPLSTTGDTNTIEVPLGTNLVIHVQTDRKLRAEKGVFVKDPPFLEAGFDNFRGKVDLAADQSGFLVVMNDLTRRYDFTVDFFDEDNIRGKRRFKVLSVIDTEPQLGNLNLHNVLLRKPKFKAPALKEKPSEEEMREQREQSELAGSYLITPDAILPLECPVKDDYGLVRVGYHYKVRRLDFELFAGGKKAGTIQIDQNARKYRAGLILSNFQFWPGNPMTWHIGPHYIAMMADLVQQDVRQAEGYKEAYVAADGFQDLLERRSDKMIHRVELEKYLTKQRSAAPWEFDFKNDRNDKNEVGFDVRKLLPQLKAIDLEKFGQPHFVLQVSVQATDNNVETGSQYVDEKGNALRGNTKKNKNGYVNFLVISENELLSQIALEEELLLEKLEVAKEKVDAGITSLSDQQNKTRDPGADMENVLNRMNEIRTALSSAGNNLREAHLAYVNIVREMEVNRVKSDRMKKIRERITEPIEDIVVANPVIPGSGSYPTAEEAVQKALLLVEEDVNNKRSPNAAAHQLNMTDANRKLDKLSRDINQVLIAMTDGIAESKLIALLASIEQNQANTTRIIEALHRLEIERTLQELINPEKKK